MREELPVADVLICWNDNMYAFDKRIFRFHHEYWKCSYKIGRPGEFAILIQTIIWKIIFTAIDWSRDRWFIMIAHKGASFWNSSSYITCNLLASYKFLFNICEQSQTITFRSILQSPMLIITHFFTQFSLSYQTKWSQMYKNIIFSTACNYSNSCVCVLHHGNMKALFSWETCLAPRHKSGL